MPSEHTLVHLIETYGSWLIGLVTGLILSLGLVPSIYGLATHNGGLTAFFVVSVIGQMEVASTAPCPPRRRPPRYARRRPTPDATPRERGPRRHQGRAVGRWRGSPIGLATA